MSEVLIYETEGGQTRVDVRLDAETVWLSLSQLSSLFGRDKSVVSRHLRNIFQDGELKRDSVVAFFATTAADGKTYQVAESIPANKDLMIRLVVNLLVGGRAE